jgi:ribA/ribD-fused uncharacterized protein
MIEKFFGKYRPLSNFWILSTPVYLPESLLGGISKIPYYTTEHAFQAAKSTEFVDYVAISRIPAKDARDAKAYGNTIQLRPGWNDIRIQVMTDLVRQKFNNSMELQNLLLSTGDQHLQEGNTWNDRYWGVDLRTGLGDNNLGKVLMQIRDEIRKE